MGATARGPGSKTLLPGVGATAAAHLVGVAPSTWRTWCRNGWAPPGIRISPKTWRWTRAELAAWVEAGCPRQDKPSRPARTTKGREPAPSDRDAAGIR
jgi:hypothetical protein